MRLILIAHWAQDGTLIAAKEAGLILRLLNNSSLQAFRRLVTVDALRATSKATMKEIDMILFLTFVSFMIVFEKEVTFEGPNRAVSLVICARSGQLIVLNVLSCRWLGSGREHWCCEPCQSLFLTDD